MDPASGPSLERPVAGVRSSGRMTEAPTRAEMVRLRQAAQDFESIFLGHMLKTMRGTLPQGGLFPSGDAQKLYRDLLDDELAKTLSRAGGLGLADILVRDLTRLSAGDRKSSSHGPARPMTQGEGRGSPEEDRP